jgi:hypothetical protein
MKVGKVLNEYGGSLQIEPASICQCVLFDLFSLGQHLLGYSGIDSCGGQVVDGFMVTLVVVIRHKFSNRLFQFAGRIVVLQFDHILHGAMPALDLALGHGVIGGTPNMLDVFDFEKCCQVFGQVGRTIIRKQPGAMSHAHLFEPCFLQGPIQGFFDVIAPTLVGRHGGG